MHVSRGPGCNTLDSGSKRHLLVLGPKEKIHVVALLTPVFSATKKKASIYLQVIYLFY